MIDSSETLLRAPEAYDPLFSARYENYEEVRMLHKGRPGYTVPDKLRPGPEKVGRLRNRHDEIIGFVGVLGLNKDVFFYEQSGMVYADKLTAKAAVSLVVELQRLPALSPIDGHTPRPGPDGTLPGASVAGRPLAA